MAAPVRLTLLAVLCWSRTAEITDSLVDLLIEVVHKIRTRAEYKVEGELVRDLKKVRGKQGLLFALAAPALEHPRRQRPRRALRGRLGGDAPRSRQGSPRKRADLPAARAQGDPRLVLPPLTADAAQAARRPAVRLLEHRLPPGHGRP